MKNFNLHNLFIILQSLLILLLCNAVHEKKQIIISYRYSMDKAIEEINRASGLVDKANEICKVKP